MALAFVVGVWVSVGFLPVGRGLGAQVVHPGCSRT